MLFSPGGGVASATGLEADDEAELREPSRTPLADADREHILETLKQTDWVDRGQEGAGQSSLDCRVLDADLQDAKAWN